MRHYWRERNDASDTRQKRQPPSGGRSAANGARPRRAHERSGAHGGESEDAGRSDNRAYVGASLSDNISTIIVDDPQNCSQRAVRFKRLGQKCRVFSIVGSACTARRRPTSSFFFFIVEIAATIVARSA